VVAGILWSWLLPVLSDQRFWHVLTFGAVLLVYAGVHALQGNSLVGVLVFGITLANYRAVRKEIQEAMQPSRLDWFAEVPIRAGSGWSAREQMLSFHGELAFLIRTFFFVLLGALVNFAGLRRYLLLSLACFVALVLARVLVVESCRFAWRGLTALEREIMIWLLPRGLITAVLALQVHATLSKQLQFLPDLAFAIILVSNVVLLGGTIRARRLPTETRTETGTAPETPDAAPIFPE